MALYSVRSFDTIDRRNAIAAKTVPRAVKIKHRKREREKKEGIISVV